jgi:hypothetical protein
LREEGKAGRGKIERESRRKENGDGKGRDWKDVNGKMESESRRKEDGDGKGGYGKDGQ